MHSCDRVNRSVPAVDLLRKGCSPCDGSPLLTKPRRLCKRDIGSHSWSGEGRPDDNLEVCRTSQTSSDGFAEARDHVMRADSYAEEDVGVGIE